MAKKARIKQAVEDEIAAILRRSEGVFLSVKSRKNGRLPRGSVMITSGIRIVTKDSTVCIAYPPMSLKNVLELQALSFLKTVYHFPISESTKPCKNV
jgi:hypothetical protein